MDTGILLSIFGLVATILFGIVGLLFIPNRHSQRQKATGAHSTAIQSGRDTTVNRHHGGNVENAPWGAIINGPTTFNSKTPDTHSDGLRLAVGMTIILCVLSILYLWGKSRPLELQQTSLLEIALTAISVLLVTVPLLWVWLFLKTRYLNKC